MLSVQVARDEIDLYQQRPLHIIVVITCTSSMKLVKRQRVGTTSLFLSEMIHIQNDEYYSYPGPRTTVDSANFLHY